MSGVSRVSGSIAIETGPSHKGSSGGIRIRTGEANEGSGGDITLLVGSGNKGDGANITLSAGPTLNEKSIQQLLKVELGFMVALGMRETV